MKPTNYFNINVPELGDRPDITKVSDAIGALEDALAGTAEYMNGTVSGGKLTLSSQTRSTKRTEYHDGLTLLFTAKQNISSGEITRVVVDELGEQESTLGYDIVNGDTVMLTYEGSSFKFKHMAIPRSSSINSDSTVTVATSKAVKDISVSVETHKNNKNNPHGITTAQIGAVDKTGDTMTGDLTLNGKSVKINVPSASGGYARGMYFQSIDGSTMLGGIGAYGVNSINNQPISYFSIGFGSLWHTENIGLTVKENELKFNGGVVYTTNNKPTAGDIGALPSSGGTINGKLTIVKPIETGSYSTGHLEIRSDAPSTGDMSAILGFHNLNTNSHSLQLKKDWTGLQVMRNSTSIGSLKSNLYDADGYKVYSPSNKPTVNDICPYRVGDILTTTLSTNPATTWAGTTWQKIEGKYLKGTSGSEASKATGGSNTKTIAVGNLPSHNHSATSSSASAGDHTHTANHKHTASQASHTHTANHTHTASQSSHTHSQPTHTHALAKGLTNTSGSGWSRDANYNTTGAKINTDSSGGDTTGSATPTITVSTTNVTTSSSTPAITVASTDVTSSTAGAHTHGITTTIGNTGSGTALNIEPAYYTVHYWLRTA